ncbi:pseudouridine-5'-phosphatase-like [Styela clava]
MSLEYKPVTHIIFDMDGVLLNTEDLYTEVYQRLCAKYGKVYDWSIKLPIMGKKPHVAAAYVIETLGLPITVDEWLGLLKAEMPKVFPSAKLLPGVEKLVKHFKHHNIPIAICTGSGTDGFSLKSTNHKDFFSLFEHITLCGDDPDVKYGKPHPDAYIVSNSRFQPTPPSPDKVLVIEDAPNGVKAAVAAGMQVVMVPDPNIPEEYHEGATLVLNSLCDLDLGIFGLPSLPDSI